MSCFKACCLALLALVFSASATAVIETYEFSDATLEARYQLLSEELRCPKCQNQNIADSNAPISQDLRRLLHQQLETGATDDEVLEFMVARYGEFVRYRPPFNAVTAVLWLAPVILLLAGAAGILLLLRGRRQESAALTADDQAQLTALLKTQEKNV
ncbi:MAG: cytochrome c-type biogenesis protein CcmH [Haliea sp.]|nr:cytochrome c-type biogenesis protein CcmH [Haliea sp.]MDP5063391.1 cytochrome c-type biogenesis protein CcmH [Haliea sp.]